MNSSLVQKHIYISLGSDCAVKWNLKQLGFVEQTFPFDWNNTKQLKMIIESLDNNFSNFFDYEIKDQSSNFDNFEKDLKSNLKSNLKLITRNKIIFPHEADGDKLDETLFIEKYTRRIIQFKSIVYDENIRKIFVRADNKKLDIKKQKILYESLERFGTKNYKIIFISYNDYPVYGAFDWKRSNINWLDILIN